jgi:hypothetical protein
LSFFAYFGLLFVFILSFSSNNLSLRYKVKSTDFYSNYGSFLSDNFRDSPFLAVKAAFPEHEWRPWLFGYTAHNVFRDRETRYFAPLFPLFPSDLSKIALFSFWRPSLLFL